MDLGLINKGPRFCDIKHFSVLTEFVNELSVTKIEINDTLDRVNPFEIKMALVMIGSSGFYFFKTVFKG